MVFHYNAADVMLQTSYCEASPTVVKEALACEIPVVSTDAGDTKEVISGVAHCALSSEDPVELAAHIMKARGWRASTGRAQLRIQELDLQQVARRLVRVYDKVARRTRVRSA
jgi:glycosyltransferase involved in cell wall biosynthesis